MACLYRVTFYLKCPDILDSEERGCLLIVVWLVLVGLLQFQSSVVFFFFFFFSFLFLFAPR